MNLIRSILFCCCFLFTTVKSYAITYKVIGPCSSTPEFLGSYEVSDFSTNVGMYSLNIFDKTPIPYLGTESGFNSILGTPTGDGAIEILSDTKMRAYGWCYSVNGVKPDVIPQDYFFKTQDDELVWFYGYSTYDDGEWVDYCVPSFTVKASQFCPQ